MVRSLNSWAVVLTLAVVSLHAFGQPIAPIIRPASAVSGTSFRANWSHVSGAIAYDVDVSTDMQFGSFLSGYSNLAVADTFAQVSGLDSGTAYYYRVRASNGSQTSVNSRTMAIITSPGYPFSIPTGTVNGVIYYSRFDTVDGTVWKAAGNGSYDSLITKGSWPRLSRTGRYLAFHRGNTPVPWQRWFYFYDFTTGKDSLDFANTDNAVDFCFGLGDSTLYFDYNCGIYREKLYATTSTVIVGRGDCWDDNPVLSPMDTALAFHNAHEGIWVGKSNGSGLKLIPQTLPGDFFPNWTPDGQWITFSRGESAPDRSLPPMLNFYKIRPDGSDLTPLTFLQASDSSRFRLNGAITPDAKYIVAPGTIGTTDGLFAIALDGSGQIMRLNTSPGKKIEWVGSISAGSGTTAVKPSRDVPVGMTLDQNYPNPFNPTTVVRGQWTVTSDVRLVVYDVLGRNVAVLADGRYPAGRYSFIFDGSKLASGVYFYQLTAGGFTASKAMVLVK